MENVRDSKMMYLVVAAIFYCLLAELKTKKYILGRKKHLIVF